MNIEKLDFGISAFKKKHTISGTNVGRIIRNYGHKLVIYGEDNEQHDFMLSHSKNEIDYKYSVGDFVQYSSNFKTIETVFSRYGILSKATNLTKKSYKTNVSEQIIATNVDSIVVLIASDQHFTIEKLERYLETFQLDNKDPRILISKSDNIQLTKKLLIQISEVYPTLEVNKFSIFDEKSVKEIEKLFSKGKTIALVGASGVGKSSLINKLNNDRDQFKVGSVRQGDNKGKHTTTSTQLIPLFKLSSYIVDTPGFKTISSSFNKGVPGSFDDILELSLKCKFSDCKHISEPNCAVKNAVKSGEISTAHYESFLKFQERQR